MKLKMKSDWIDTFRKLPKKGVALAAAVAMGITAVIAYTPSSTASALEDPNINPEFTIQHYLNFEAVSLGINNGNGSVTYKERVKQDWEDEPDIGAAEVTTNGTVMPIYNTEARFNETPNGIPKNGSGGEPEYGVVLNNQNQFATHLTMKKLFLDETAKFMEKPAMEYMNRMYKSNSDSNFNYTLKEIWLSYDANVNKKSINRDDFMVFDVPFMKDTNGQKIEIGTQDGNTIYRHDPSTVKFTNNPDYSEEIEDPENPDKKIIKTLNQENGTYQPTNFGTDEKPRWVILVSNKMTIRFVFDPSSDDDTKVNSNFFDYDITNGQIYNSEKDAEDGKNPQPTSSQGNNKVYAQTNSQGINSDTNYSDANVPKLAFGNANTGTGLANLYANIGGVNNFINRYNEQNRHTLGGGAVFGLVTGLNANGTLIWNSNIKAPALFDTSSSSNPQDKNYIAGKTNYVNGEFGLQFNRTGGTYILDHVNKGNSAVGSASNLSTFEKVYDDNTKQIYSNQFWPMDAAESYGTDGHDLKFGKSDTENNYSSGGSKLNNFTGKAADAVTLTNKVGNSLREAKATSKNGVFPISDDTKDHNAYFGMTFSTDFYVDPGYAGPLRYYFYGDDDLFVFLSRVDGNELKDTKLVADLGGVHSSVGMYVNLWKYVNDGKGPIPYTETSTDGTKSNSNSRSAETQHYRLTYYYAERGSSGSTCYMRFTLPFESIDPTPRIYNGSLQVEKEVKKQAGDTSSDNEYTFRLELKNNDANGNFDQSSPLVNRYGYEIVDKDGNKVEKADDEQYAYNGSIFKLKDGEKFKITEQLPQGTLYRVTELNSDGDVITTFASGTVSNKNPEGELFTDFSEGKVVEGSTEVNEQTGEGNNYVKFINATAPASLTLSKAVVGDRTTDAFNFKVTLTDKEDKTISQVSLLKNGEEADDIQADENGDFNLTLKDKDTYILYNMPNGTKFRVEEETNSQYLVDHIDITDSTIGTQVSQSTNVVTGTLETSGNITEENRPKVHIIYNNRVELNTTAEIEVEKNLTGKSAAEGESYTFEMRADNEEAISKLPDPIQTSVIYKAGESSAKSSFDPITFVNADRGKTFNFLVKEVNGGQTLDHIEYDGSVYEVSIKVVPEESEDDLTTEITWTKAEEDPAETGEGSTLTFNNRYRPETDLVLNFTKQIRGPHNGNEKYTFVISAADGTPMPDKTEVTLSADDPAQDTIEGAFGPITYKKASKDPYVYTIQEKVLSDSDNLIEDTTKYTVTVEVTENDTTEPYGLQATITNVQPSENIVFTNTYQQTEFAIPVEKHLDGRQLNEQDLFQFGLYDENNQLLQTLTLNGSQFTGRNEMAGEFAPITYTKAGSYVYTVKEVQGNAENIVYDKTAYTVTVNVEENDDHLLSATPSFAIDNNSANSVVFLNKYVTNVEWTPKANKQVIGGSNAGYSFVTNIQKSDGTALSDEDGVTVPANNEAVSDEAGNIPFGSYIFTKPGKFQVTVKENTPAGDSIVNGIQYDTHTLTYNLDVQHNEQTGDLSIVESIEGNPTFTNDAGLAIEKRLIAGKDVILTEQDFNTAFEFKLSLKDSKGNTLNDAYTLQIDGNSAGTVTNGSTIHLKKDQVARIYGLPVGAQYKVDEIKKDGYLLINSQNTEGSVSTGAGSEAKALFINIKPGTVSSEIQGYKELINIDGSDKDMIGGEFAFSITAEAADIEKWPEKTNDEPEPQDDNGKPLDNAENEETEKEIPSDTEVKDSDLEDKSASSEEEIILPDQLDITEIPMPAVTTVTNNASGEFFFGPIEFEHAGTYTYRISEVKGSDGEIKYDENSYLAVIKVKDIIVDEVKTGVEIDSIRYETTDHKSIDHIVFVNEYEGTPGLKIRKYQKLNNGEKTQNLLTGNPGDTVTYILEVSAPEEATAPAMNVVVSDFVPQPNKGSDMNAQLIFIEGSQGHGTYNSKTCEIRWNLGTIRPGTENTVTVTYTVRIPEISKKASWTNVAAAYYSNNPEGPDTPVNSEDVTVEANPLQPVISIQKWQKKETSAFQQDPMNVEAKDIVTYELRIANTGQAIAKDVVVTDTVPEGLELVENSISDDGKVDKNGLITWKLGNLAPGGGTRVSFKVKVPVVKEATDWTNIGYVNYEDPNDPDPTPSNEVEIHTDVPSLTIEKQQSVNEGPFIKGEDPVHVNKQDVVTYKLIVSNPSKVDAINAVLEDEIPAGLVYVENSAEGANLVNGKLVWALGTVKANTTVEKTFQVRVPKVEKYTLWKNTGSVSYDNNPDNPDNPNEPNTPIPSNTVQIDTTVPKIEIRKSQALNDGVAQEAALHAKSKDIVTYYLKVNSTGEGTAENVRISDVIPEGLILVEDSISANGKLNGNTIEWSLGDMASGTTKTVSFKVTIPEIRQAEKWTNVGAAVFENNPDNPEDPDEPDIPIPSNEVEVDAGVPKVIIEKSQAVNDGEQTTEKLLVNAGDKVTYQLAVKNIGTEEAEDVLVKDAIPEGLVLVPGSISAKGSEKNGVITWKLGNLKEQESYTVTFQVEVPEGPQKTWTNFGTVSYPNNPDNPTDPDEPDTETPSNEVEIYNKPSVVIHKTQSLNDEKPTTALLSGKAEDRVTYYLTLTNTSGTDAVNLTVSDAVPSGLILDETSISDDGKLTDNTINWNLEILPAGESKTVSFTVKLPTVTKITTWKNVGSVVYENNPDGPDTPIPSNEVEVNEDPREPEVTIEKSQAINDGKQTTDKLLVKAGDTVTYQLTVKNIGSKEAEDVLVKDSIPEGLKLVSGSISNKGTEKDGVISWKLGNLKEQESVTVSFQIKVPEGKQQNWKNIGTVSYPNNPENPTDPDEPDTETPSNEVEIYNKPSVVIHKTQSLNKGKPTTALLSGKANDTVTYYLTLKNTSGTDAENLTITDAIPEGLILDEASISDNGALHGNSIIWNLAVLKAGESKTVFFTIKLPSVSKNTTWKNVASVVYENNPEGPDTPIPSNEVEVEEEVNPKTPGTPGSSSHNGKPTPSTATKLSVRASFMLCLVAMLGFLLLFITKRSRT